MTRNMELIRTILFEIEKKHKDVALLNFSIDNVERQEVAYHCKLAYEAGLVDHYKPHFGGNRLLTFSVGGLTWSGQDYLELIRNDEIWQKTINEVEEKKLPKTIEFLAKIAGRFTGAMLDEMN